MIPYICDMLHAPSSSDIMLVNSIVGAVLVALTSKKSFSMNPLEVKAGVPSRMPLQGRE